MGNVSVTTKKAMRPVLAGLKRIFVLPFFVATLAIAIYAAREWIVSGAWPWLGPLIVAGVFHAYVGGIVILRRARTSAYPSVVLLAILAGSAVAGYAAWDDLGTAPLLLAFVASALELLYLTSYSFFRREPCDTSAPRS